MMNEMTICIVVFILLFSSIFPDNPCRYNHPEKGVIDLTSLGRRDGKAAFVNATPSTGSDYRYNYNPCRPFSEESFREGTRCENVSACQIGLDGIHMYAIGTQESAQWNAGAEIGDSPSIAYSFGEKITHVILRCSTTGVKEFEVLGEGPINVFVLRLTHKCACWNGCSSGPTTTTTTTTTTTVSPIIDSCRFEYPGKGIIDLTSLGRRDGNPAYSQDVPSERMNYKYSYNPCKPFSAGPECSNVAACQKELQGAASFILGTQNSVFWNPGSGVGATPSVSYSYGVRTVVVGLQCSTTGQEQFEVIGEDPMNVYIFRLTHKCACWNGCSSQTTTMVPTSLPPITDACRFEYLGKGVIDFSFIGRTDERAAYTDETTRTASNFKYSYNPCKSFSQGTGCIGVSLCQISNDEQLTVTLGTQESAWWSPGSGTNEVPSVNYIYGNKKVTVLLQCSLEGNNEFQAFGEDPVNTFKFQLTHRCACWNKCSST